MAAPALDLVEDARDWLQSRLEGPLRTRGHALDPLEHVVGDFGRCFFSVVLDLSLLVRLLSSQVLLQGGFGLLEQCAASPVGVDRIYPHSASNHTLRDTRPFVLLLDPAEILQLLQLPIQGADAEPGVYRFEDGPHRVKSLGVSRLTLE